MSAGPGAGAEPLRLEDVERLADVREDWSRLAEPAGHPFATWEWNECWWRHMGSGRRLYTFACRDADDQVAGVLPMYVAATRPVRVARFLGFADLQSPVCAAADRPRVAAALIGATGRPHACRVLFAERMPADQGWGELLGGTLVRTDSTPVLPIGGRTWDEFLATKKRKFRGNLRRAEERLVAGHGLTFRLCDDPGRIDDDMETLFGLHTSRWGEGATGVFDGASREVHREFAAAALRRGWLRLWLAEIGGEPAAAWYGWRFAGTDWFFQSGRDPRFDRLSVGTTLLVHTLREAFDDRMSAYHFLAGDEDYKRHFAAEDPGAESRVVGSGAAARMGGLAIRLAGRLPARARLRLLRGGGG